jgi:outer membrane protein
MSKLLKILILFVLLANTASAQEKWNLQKIVEYVFKNNLTVKQAEITARLSALQYKQSMLSQIPTAFFTDNVGYNSGKNQDPTTFSLITKGYLSSSMSLQASADLFNWYSKRNTIQANKYDLQASIANVEKQQNDLALLVANAYLQILLAMQQTEIARVQLQQSQFQLSTIRKRVEAGALPELNAAELEAQVARDSANYIATKGNIEVSILNLKAFMSLDAATPLDIETPSVDKIPVENIADLQPEAVYALAVKNLPQQRVNELRYLFAQKSAQAAKGARMPTFSMYGSLGSSYLNQANQINSVAYQDVPFGTVNVGGTDYTVFGSEPVYTYGKTSYFKQVNNNFRQSIGISLSVPIFNGGTLQTNYQRGLLNVKSMDLQRQQDNLKLKQDIYQAYNAALVALEKFNASAKAVEASQKTYDFSQKRFDVGMLSTFELTTNQNNLFTAKLQYVLNQFDYVFKMKVLEFYKGIGLKL